MNRLNPILLLALSLSGVSCARVTVDPIEVKPIHITMDINVKIDRELNEFFAFENKFAATQSATTQAATAAVVPVSQ